MPPKINPTEAQIETALTAPGMFYCPVLSLGPATISYKQCLFNQSRFKAQGFPHSCSSSCVIGAEIRRKHEGEEVSVVQFNILQGGFVAGNRKEKFDGSPPVCPAKRIAQEKQGLREPRAPRPPQEKKEKKLGPNNKAWWTPEKRQEAKERVERSIKERFSREKCACGAEAYGKSGQCFTCLRAGLAGPGPEYFKGRELDER